MTDRLPPRTGPDPDEVIALVRDLVRIPSPTGDEHAIVRAIAGRCEAIGWHVDAADGRGILASNGPEAELAFLAYLDSPPAGAMRDAFAASLVGAPDLRAVRGRGAVSKAPLGAALAACVHTATLRPGARLAFAATTKDNDGLRAVLTASAPRIRRAIVAEPTDGTLGVRARGIVWLDIVIEGHPMHAGEASLGDNPIDAMADVVVSLRRLAHPAHGDFPRAPLTPMSAASDGAAPRTPERMRLGLDRRWFPDESLDDIRAQVERALTAACASHPGTFGHCEVAGAMVPFAAAPASETAAVLSEATRAVTGRAPARTSLPFATNAGYAAACGIDAVAYGPGRIADLGDDEHAGVERIVECARVYAEVARRLA